MLGPATLMGGVPGLPNLMEQYTRLSRAPPEGYVIGRTIGIRLATVTITVALLTVGVWPVRRIGVQFQSLHLTAQRFPEATYRASGARVHPYNPLCRRVILE